MFQEGTNKNIKACPERRESLRKSQEAKDKLPEKKGGIFQSDSKPLKGFKSFKFEKTL